MDFIEIFLVGLGLSMDAFAVSVCKGLSFKRLYFKYMVIVGLYFGLFQGLMPMIGYFLGSSLGNIMISIDHWVAFILLFLIGFNMLKDIYSKDESVDDKINFKVMFPLAIATSIDAFSVGITLAFFSLHNYHLYLL